MKIDYEYEVLIERYPKGLSSAIVDRLNIGWMLQGGVTIHNSHYCQAMYRATINGEPLTAMGVSEMANISSVGNINLKDV